MKHLKILEINKSTSSIKNIANKYHELLEQLMPVAIKRYNEIINDEKLDFGQDIVDVYGGDLFFVVDTNKLKLEEIKIHDNKIFFTLKYYDFNGGNESVFYIPFTEDELKNVIIGVESDKYNL